jgi:hypothetical protein
MPRRILMMVSWALSGVELMPAFLMARGLSYLGWPAGRPEMQSGRDLAPLLIYMVTDMGAQIPGQRALTGSWKVYGLRPGAEDGPRIDSRPTSRRAR